MKIRKKFVNSFLRFLFIFEVVLGTFMILFILKVLFLDMIIPHKMSFSITNSSSADISQVKIKSGLGGLMEINSIPKDGHIEKTAWMKPGECWSFEYMTSELETRKVQLTIYKFNSEKNEISVFDDRVVLDGDYHAPYEEIECRN